MKTTKSYADTGTIDLMRSLLEASRTVSRKEEAQSAEWGLAGSEFDVIATLGNTEGMRMSDLARRTLNTKGNITRVVKELERRGLVERHRNRECEREVFVRLTDEGEELFIETYPQKFAFLKEMFDERLTEKEQRQLSSLLWRLSDADS